MGTGGSDIRSDVEGRVQVDRAGGRILVSNTDNIDNLLLGFTDEGEIKIKLARKDVDVKTASDDELIFSSDFNSFKIWDDDTITIPGVTVNSSTANGVSTKIVPHTLGRVPAVMAFIVDNYGRRIPLPGFRTYEGAEDVQGPFGPGDIRLLMPLNEYVTYSVDAEKVVFYNWIVNKGLSIPASYTASAVSVKYYILIETAA